MLICITLSQIIRVSRPGLSGSLYSLPPEAPSRMLEVDRASLRAFG